MQLGVKPWNMSGAWNNAASALLLIWIWFIWHVKSCLSLVLFYFYLPQLVFEARAVKLCPCAKIKVKNVRFVACHADYFPHVPTRNFYKYSTHKSTSMHTYVSPCLRALILFVQDSLVTLKLDYVAGIRTTVTTLTGWSWRGWTTPLV